MNAPTSNPTALIFHRNLLPKSETFVRAQADNLRYFEPYYAGVQNTGGMELPKDRTCSMAGGGLYGAASARLFKLTGFSPAFLAKIRSIKPTIVHAHFEESALAALPLSRKLGVPLITTFHGYDATAKPSTSGPRKILNQVYDRQRHQLQKEGNLFVAVSEFIRQKLIGRGYPAERIATVPIGVDVDLFEPAAEEPRKPIVLFVGRLVEKKGVTYLLSAMAKVARTRKDVRLVIIGDGPLMPALIDQACALKLPNVVFMGACDSETVRRQMSIASVLVSPSVTAASGDSEGLPIVICEAQAMGVPVVATKHAGIPEIIKNGKNGFLVPERSIPQLALGISQILRFPELRHRMGITARINVCLNFNLMFQNARLESLYQDVIREHVKRRSF